MLRYLMMAALLFVLGSPLNVHAEKRYKSSFKKFSIPPLTLVDQDRREVKLSSFLAEQEPFVLSFIFTTCTTVCPIMTATMAHLRRELDKQGENLNLVSVSIDPEYDTPRRLKEYAKRYDAGDQWRFLTGRLEDIQRVQKHFTGFVSDKMDHWPVYIFKAPGKDEWLVIDGLVSGVDLAREYRLLREAASE